MIRLQKLIATLFLVSCLLLTSCTQTAPSRFDGAQQESAQKGATAVVDSSQAGGNFNRYFPDSGSGYERLYSQEKKGSAQAKLKKDGKEIAILAITDTLNQPSAAAKFNGTSETIKGYPSVSQGSTATAILVGDRYQVKIRSKDSSFTPADREQWLGKFDLRGLSKLK